jgi:hypothetical protein
MTSWINLTALWEIVVVGLVAGAGLPALFAIGIRLLGLRASASASARSQTAGAGPGTTDSDGLVGGSVPGMIAAAICFLIVLAAIGWSIFAIYQSGHPHK